MSFKVVILNSAKLDLNELGDYVVTGFSQSVWRKTSGQLKRALGVLVVSPQAGAVLSEIEMLNLNEYRQVICGMNRIIYEIRQQSCSFMQSWIYFGT
ncbi:type II toxin-antitoxin system RelE/ParE family toxin [Pseudomonas sp. LP_7_YM]|uniref:type II toxin-antitoxin system RelE/ParE family toxin n=1 Tax=Pseudomonas sp. LP_7_YM TaxID=2485137 RepID=UPI0010E350AB|nr:type II toxin-antitoxin system RelE/ParE family toxin [Pseudomonas sp. LP_7_YM]TDV66110.1 ParE-like toxin of type II ParDE toxin-antitoxin system [Pseudomonas sp. LP_7_YM]